MKKTFWQLLSATFLVRSAVCKNMPFFFLPFFSHCVNVSPFCGGQRGIFMLSLMNLCIFFSPQFYLLTWMTVANCLHWMLFSNAGCCLSIVSFCKMLQCKRKALHRIPAVGVAGGKRAVVAVMWHDAVWCACTLTLNTCNTGRSWQGF